ncbi:MAG: PAS domain-containing protein, partial [Myxococcales bacterium]|nr:PAS domain-containing protein [Myxococcales bacterium]
MLLRVSDGVVAVDRELRYTFVNDRAYALLQRPVGSLLGKLMRAEFPEVSSRPFFQAYERALETGVVQRIREHYPPWGQWLENRIYPSADGLTIVFDVVTDSVVAEHALEEERAFVREVLERIRDPILVFPFDDGLPGPIRFANAAACDVLGYTREELSSLTVRELGEPVDFRAITSRVVAEGSALFPRVLVTSAGERVPVEVHAALVRHGGRPMSVSVCRDVRPQLAAAAEREAAVALREAVAKVTAPAFATLELGEMMRSLLEGLVAQLGVAAATIALVTRDGQWVDVAEAAGPMREGLVGVRRPHDPAWEATLLSFTRAQVRRLDDPIYPLTLPSEVRAFHEIAFRALVRDGRMVGTLAAFATADQPFPLEQLDLLDLVAERMATAIERARLHREREEAYAQLARVSASLIRAQEDERRAIARDLHDELGQDLSALMMQLSHGADPVSVADARATARGLVHRVRALALELRPPMLDDLGLVPTLEWLVQRQAERTGRAVRFAHGANRRVPADAATAIYRIAQEALTNVARHTLAEAEV